jgi:hypothetical protein
MRRLSCVVVLLVGGLCQAQDVALSDILIDGEGWKPFFKDCKSIGDIATSRQGPTLIVSDPDERKVWALSSDGKPAPIVGLKGATGLCSAGRAIVACNPERKAILARPNDSDLDVTRIELDIAADNVVLSREGFYLTSQKSGALYFQRTSRDSIAPNPRGPQMLCEVKDPVGLVLWPDQSTLVVSEAHSPHLLTFRVNWDDTLSSKEKFYTLCKPSGNRELTVGTMTVDSLGRLYCATSIGVQVFDRTGRMIGVLTKPKDAPVTHVALGGEKGNTLYIACGNEIFARQIKGKGVGWPDEKPK